MKRFKSARHAQRFLSAHDQINNLFLLPRHRMTATRAERPSRRGTTASSKPHNPQHPCSPSSSPNPRLPPNNLTVPNRQIAHELGLCESDAQAMVLRHGIVAKTPDVVLSGDVEFDELYVVAGHKGNPEAVRAKGRQSRRNRLKGIRGRGTLEKEKPPIFGMIERGGQVVIRMLVQQATIHPIIEKPKARTSLPTSIASTPSFLVSATATRPSAMVEANTPATRTVMGSARST